MAKKETTKPAAKKPAAKKETTTKPAAKKPAAKKEPVKKSDSNKTNTSVLGVGTKMLNPFSGRHIVVAHPITGKKDNK